ncbi:NADAR family protein [Neolewinella agarilytica]|uniref:NADAR family protein n=1 Tax=Neolewinella agarilytica TaxID=478744 RepID=UPI0023537C60|nr:NADAR family protein [Neolewinella agarilytica]
MKIEEIEGRIVLIPESNTEQEVINSIIQVNENLIFQLQKRQDFVSFVNLGPKESACNVAINILYSGESDVSSLISNLGHTPFVMDKTQFESVEAFWQSLKFPEDEREEIAKLHGKKAKKIGKRIEYGSHIKYRGGKIQVGSPEHWALMKMACWHKFTQNELAQKALLETGIRPLYHKPRKDSTSIPGPIMAGIWMDIRSKLRKENGLKSVHLDLLK